MELEIGGLLMARFVGIDVIKQIWETEQPPDFYYTLYVHVPYCYQKCAFCRYHIYNIKNFEQLDTWIDRIKMEIDIYKKILDLRQITFKALSIGGGTPTLLNPDRLEKLYNMLYNSFNIEADMNTIEASPDTLSESKMKALRNLGVNRISIGIETFDSNILKLENRIIHPFPKQVISEARRYFSHVNVDLLYGLKRQTGDTLLEDVNTTAQCGATSITIYSIMERKITYGSKFGDHVRRVLNKANLSGYTLENIGNNDFAFIKEKINRYKFWYELCPYCCTNNIGLGFKANSWNMASEKLYTSTEAPDRFFLQDGIHWAESSFETARFMRKNKELAKKILSF